MDPLVIQTDIKRAGGSMAAIAESCAVHHSVVRDVIFGECKSRRIATTIALFLGRSLDDLWPGQYPQKYRRRSKYDVLLRLQGAAAIAKRTSKAA